MGAVKEWAFTHQECACCGRDFLPWLVSHKIHDLKLPTCSQQCEDEITEVFERIADNYKQGDVYDRQED